MTSCRERQWGVTRAPSPKGGRCCSPVRSAAQAWVGKRENGPKPQRGEIPWVDWLPIGSARESRPYRARRHFVSDNPGLRKPPPWAVESGPYRAKRGGPSSFGRD